MAVQWHTTLSTQIEENKNALYDLREGQGALSQHVREAHTALEREIKGNQWHVSATISPGYASESFNAGNRTGWSLGGSLELTTRGWGLGVDGFFSQTSGSGVLHSTVTTSEVTPYVILPLGESEGGVFSLLIGPSFQWGTEQVEKQIGPVFVEGESTVSLLGGTLGVRWEGSTVEGGLHIGYLPFGTSSSTTRVNGEAVDTASGSPSAWYVSAHAGGDFGNFGAGLRVRYQQETLNQETTVSSIQIGPYVKLGR